MAAQSRPGGTKKQPPAEPRHHLVLTFHPDCTVCSRGESRVCQGGVLGIGLGTELEVGARKGVRDRAGDRVGVRG